MHNFPKALFLIKFLQELFYYYSYYEIIFIFNNIKEVESVNIHSYNIIRLLIINSIEFIPLIVCKIIAVK